MDILTTLIVALAGLVALAIIASNLPGRPPRSVHVAHGFGNSYTITGYSARDTLAIKKVLDEQFATRHPRPVPSPPTPSSSQGGKR